MNAVALHAGNAGPSTRDGNWTWLVPGRVPTLVDGGVGHAGHLADVRAALGGAPLAQVVVTHGHPDHASGVETLVASTPALRCLKMPWPGEDDTWGVAWVPVADGDVVEAGDTRLTAVHTPGHAPDHLCLWDAETRTLFGGDLVMAGSTIYIPGSRGGDVAAYLQSLDRIIALEPARVLPAHGPAIEAPLPLLRASRTHRLQREAQIVALLRTREWDVDALTGRMYPDLCSGLRGRARETVIAHLLKLERDGRAVRRGAAWRLA